MGVFDVIKFKKGADTKVVKPSSLEKLVFRNREELDELHEEIEAINLSFEKYKKNYKSLIIGFGLSIGINIALVVFIILKFVK